MRRSLRFVAIVAVFGAVLAIIRTIDSRRVDSGRPASAINDSFIHGTVSDPSGFVSGARVRYAGAKQFVETDALGRFTLPPPPSEAAFVSVWKSGYFIGGCPIDNDRNPRIALTRLPADDDENYRWVRPRSGQKSDGEECGRCHDSILRQWENSGHARSTSNTRFQGMFSGAADGQWNLERERPDGVAVCASCHAPTTGSLLSEFSPEFRPDAASDLPSVHCDFCHKIVGPAGGEVGLTHGRFGLQLMRPSKGQLVFGPFEDASRLENSFAPIQKQSRMCASCHEGLVFGVRVYETYSEWQASPAGKLGTQCQDCHMKPTGEMTNMAPGHGGVERDPRSLANHMFFDGSQLDMLKRCLNLNLSLDRDVDGVHAKIEIAVSGVGHRVPTGLPDRNLTLVVEAFDANEQSLQATRGATLTALTSADSKGKSGKLFAKVLKDWEGKSPVPFWRAAPEFDDTRLTPGQTERLEFAFPPGAVSIRARLIYRKFWPEVTKQKGWPDDAWVVADKTSAVR